MEQQSKCSTGLRSLLLLRYSRILGTKSTTLLMILRAYAKINLGLHIVGKRPDGYHDIETVFHQINLYDEINIVRNNEGIHLLTDSQHLPVDARNLCIRAAHILRDLTGITTGVEITLKKRIPIGAGLGGGSSDAAVVLKGLAKLWALEITDQELQTISASLGSDVPFFMNGGTAYGTGRGELLKPMNLPIPYWILVVTPPVHISTSWAYSNVTVDHDLRRENLQSLLQDNIQNLGTLNERLLNEFEQIVFAAFPDVHHVKEKLVQGGAKFALMSGSGSSVFGFFQDEHVVKKLMNELSTLYHTSLTEPHFKPRLN